MFLLLIFKIKLINIYLPCINNLYIEIAIDFPVINTNQMTKSHVKINYCNTRPYRQSWEVYYY